jgi:hypothetical protein
MMETDVQLQRLFARQPLPEPNPALVAAVIAGVEWQRRQSRVVSIALGVCLLLATAALAPLATTCLSQAFALLQGVELRGAHFPLLATALMALASIGAAAWATRN